MKILDRPFVVLADDFGRHPSSIQHIFTAGPRPRDVIWINSVGSRRPRLTPSDLRRAWGVLRTWTTPADATREGIRVLSPVSSPGPPNRLSRWWNARAWRHAVERSLAPDSAPVVVTTLPTSADIVGTVRESLFVYYCVDDYASWPGGYGESMRRLEESLLTRVDGVVASSRRLHETKRPRSGRSHYLPHGVDSSRFTIDSGHSNVTHPMQDLPGPRVGYVGLLDGRHDLELWEGLAEALPEVSLVTVGPADLPRSRLPGRVHQYPAVPYASVPAVLRSLDVLVLPYDTRGAGEFINPLKGKEALACGVPIVSTALPELQSWPVGVRIATDSSSFVQAVRDTLDAPLESSQVESFLAQESWSQKAHEFFSTLDTWWSERHDG